MGVRFVDHYGTLWVGTMSAGLARLETGITDLPHVPDRSRRSAVAARKWRHVLVRGHPWKPLGGDLRGRAGAFRSRQRQLPALRVDSAEEGLSSDRATALAEDQTGKLWVGTDGGGLNLLDPDTGRSSASPTSGMTPAP